MARSPSSGVSEATAKFIHDVGGGDTHHHPATRSTGRRTARRGRTKSEGGSASSWSPTTSRPATSPPPSPSWSRASTASERDQVLLGVTGSGKTFTMAKIIEATQRPALILAPNKTLAAQLYSEFKQLLPGQRGRVLRQLLRLLPARGLRPADRHLHREGQLDQRADRPHAPLGHAGDPGARRRHRRGLGLLHLRHRLGRDLHGHDLHPERRPAGRRGASCCADLVALQYKRNDAAFERGTFRRRGDTLEIFPAHYEDRAWRISLFGDEIEIDHRVRPAHRQEDRRPGGRARSTPTATTSRRARRSTRPSTTSRPS